MHLYKYLCIKNNRNMHAIPSQETGTNNVPTTDFFSRYKFHWMCRHISTTNSVLPVWFYYLISHSVCKLNCTLWMCTALTDPPNLLLAGENSCTVWYKLKQVQKSQTPYRFAIYRLITAYLLLRVNLDKIMHARWDFDGSSARTRRVSALDKHQNWSASALFCLNSRA